VVIKTPDETLKFDPNYPKFVERFIKEGRLLAKLWAEPHPHIVRVTDLFEEGNTHCLVMDFISRACGDCGRRSTGWGCGESVRRGISSLASRLVKYNI
jgi:serine/threonine protein kinase